jgi:PAS domain S-box-containing protein
MTEEELKEELQRAKEDLEDLEMYIEEFSAFLPLAVCYVNPVGIIININKAFEKLTGYIPIEIVGEPLVKVFLEKKEVEKLLSEVQKKEILETKELTSVSKEKKRTPVRVSVSARKDEKGNFIGYFFAFSDITELKKFRERLEEKVKKRTKELENSRMALMNMLEDVEESRKALVNMLEDLKEAKGKAEEEKEKTLSVITNFTDGLLVFDKEGKLSLINPQAEDFFDIKGKDIIGRPILELSAFPNIEPLVRIVGREIKGVFRKELSIKENLTLEVSTVPMVSREERLGTLVILHDITREKTIEKMKTEFVSLAAHQLRTPLSAIKWTLKMFLDGDLGAITKEQRDFIEKTYNSNERMITLINELLDITRIEEGRYLYKPVLADLKPIVQFVINSYKAEIKKKKIGFEFKAPKGPLPKIKLDIEKIRLAIDNLIDNAIRYTPDFGKVTVSLEDKKGEIMFSVKDSGVGIPREQQERVFTKFFRGTNVIRIATEGTGLGLFITKNIIEAHGGKIWFESEENKGTTFYFVIPIKEEFGKSLKEF